jgi:hypothetical protein
LVPFVTNQTLIDAVGALDAALAFTMEAPFAVVVTEAIMHGTASTTNGHDLRSLFIFSSFPLVEVLLSPAGRTTLPSLDHHLLRRTN